MPYDTIQYLGLPVSISITFLVAPSLVFNLGVISS